MTSWINEQSAFHDPNSVTAGERVIEYLDKPPKKPRTELKNRNYNTILLPNNQGQLTGGAYGASNNEIIQTDGAYDTPNNKLFPIEAANNVNFTQLYWQYRQSKAFYNAITKCSWQLLLSRTSKR